MRLFICNAFFASNLFAQSSENDDYQVNSLIFKSTQRLKGARLGKWKCLEQANAV